MDKTETGIPVEEKGIEHLVLDWLQWSNEFDVKRAEMTLSLLGERSVALKDCEAKLQEAPEIIEMLKGKLEFYANVAFCNSKGDVPLYQPYMSDKGRKAKEALAHPKLKAWEGEK